MMNGTAKHTPGPWTVQKHHHAAGDLWLTVLRGAWDVTHNHASRPEVIADAAYSAMSDEENEANAHLIAAAPDLLAALRAMVLNDAHTYRDCHKAALAAIAKAEGK
jgi:uncharacterized cupin superfamily protein